ncbi:MAG TPA: hypothetical protein VGG29_02720 [Caulobacteraceae bacterium]|jgi:hypothetical protein
MILELTICFAAFYLLLLLLRRDQLSLGLPFAYLSLLLVMHLPGAVAHVVAGSVLPGGEFVELGLRYTTIGVVCFVLGVWVARLTVRPPHQLVKADRRKFAMFCLVGGWIFVYALAPLSRIPSLGAAISTGGAIWMLGTLLGLRAAMQANDMRRFLVWGSALAVYPVLMLILGGFLSYGVAAVTIVTSVLAVAARSQVRAIGSILLVIFVGMTVFVNYFDHRTDIRESVWGGASMENRVDSVLGAFAGAHFIDLSNDKDLNALDQRLNQNMFVGLAAARLQDKEIDYLNGQSVIDGALAVIPRAFWPNKPEVAGSGQMVAQATGLKLNEDTSWGVGNVLEFYINFGLAGVIVGFFLLGLLLATLDVKAAAAGRHGDFRAMIALFLPCVAVIQPGGSFVEMTGGAAAAVLASFAWGWAWDVWRTRRRDGARVAGLAEGRFPQSRHGPAA